METSSTAALALALASSLTSGSMGAQPSLLGLLGMSANPPAAQAAPNLAQNAMLNQIAAQLKLDGPVTNRLFVASLDYKVDEGKLKEVFGLAGNVLSVSLFRDRDGKSRGMAVVEYDTPFEALNACSMLNKRKLLDREMTVRFDTKPPMDESAPSQPQVKLPSGLQSIGSGLSLPGLAPALPLGALSVAGTDLAGLGLNLNNSGMGLLGSGANAMSNSSSSNGVSGYSNGSSNGSSGYSSRSSNNTISKVFVKNVSWILFNFFCSCGKLNQILSFMNVEKILRL